jgi:3-deoxy-D-manno-octulosonic-acid transferase
MMQRYIYTWLLRLVVPLALLQLLWRGWRNRIYWGRLPERFGYIPAARSLRAIWLHAVSVGEVRAAVPLIRALMSRYPEHRLIVTTMTSTGSEQVHSLLGEDVLHYYVPYDLPGAVARFLDHTRPDIAIMMETELWPNIFYGCRTRSIPIVIANMRISEGALKRYLKVPKLTAQTLALVDVLAAQSEIDTTRLRQLKAPAEKIRVTGSIKFDISLPASLRERADVLRGQWGRDRPVWLAASTREGEDELVLAARAELLKRFPNLLLVIAPRHPERFAAVARLAKKSARVALHSETRHVADDVQILIGDTMGELQLFYGAVDVAFVGGSLVPVGGHNILEAAAVGTPVVFGPHMNNFQDIARLVVERGAGVQIQNAAQLTPAVSDFLGNANRRDGAGEAGKKLIAENRGALERTLKLIAQLLPPSGTQEPMPR